MSQVSRSASIRTNATSASKRSRSTVVARPPRRIPRPLSSSVNYFGKTSFPKQLVNTMVYGGVMTISPTSGLAKQVFVCNGLYDPDYTGTGTQPLYYDQLTSIYSHYEVLSSSIVIQIADLEQYNSTVTLYIDDDVNTATSCADAIQREGCVWDAYTSGSGLPKKLIKKWNATATFGNVGTTSNMSGTYSTNASEASYYVFQYMDPSLGRATSFTLTYQIRYKVRWYELATIATS